MAPEDLEHLFVQREPLAIRLVSQISASVLGKGKQHNLVIGPRGMGKTHLLSIVYHRLQALTELQGKAVICRLPEDEWGINSFLELLLRILRRGDSGKPLVAEDQIEAVYELTQEAATQAATRLLLEALGQRTLVLLIENLDEVFYSLGSQGQARLRSFFQEQACCTTLATTPAIFAGIMLHTSPFYGFFRIQHLDKLGVEEAVQLMVKIAERRGDDDLASFAQSPLGRGRIRAVYHLSGGNPRIHVVFAEFIHNRGDLDELIQAFMRMLDELTPYYQAKMQVLPPQQRQLVEFLCDHWKPAPVKEVARRCFISQQTCSSQLRKLAEAGLVISETRGRETWFEVAEPLMRHCIAVKKQQGEPVRLFVEFLRIWKSPVELTAIVADGSLSKQLRECAAKAVDASQFVSPITESVWKDLSEAIKAERWQQAATISEELHAQQPSSWHSIIAAGLWIKVDDVQRAFAYYEKALADPQWLSREQIDTTSLCLGMMYAGRKNYQRAIPLLDAVTEHHRKHADAQEMTAWCYVALNNWEAAGTRFSWLILREKPCDRLNFAQAMCRSVCGDASLLEDWINRCENDEQAELLGIAESEISSRLSWLEAPPAVLEIFGALNRSINIRMHTKGLLRPCALGFLRGVIGRSKSIPQASKQSILSFAESWPDDQDGFLKASAMLWLEIEGKAPDFWQWPQEERAVLEEMRHLRSTSTPTKTTVEF